MISLLLRSRMAGAIALAIILLIFLVQVAHRGDYQFPSLYELTGNLGGGDYGEKPGDNGKELRKFFLEHISPPSVKIDAEKYQPYGASEWKLPENAEPRWTEPLGKKLCIFDLDNRPFEDDGQIFGNEIFSWNNATHLHGLSLGILSHWLYAKIHGYQYYFVRSGGYDDRRASWKKPSIMGRILKKHQTCVFMDSDTFFNHLDLPLEWLMNYWDIDKNNNSIALAVDPNADHNKDKQGKLYDNTGFFIAQNRPVTFEMMDDWAVCADDGGKHPDCIEYRTTAFGRPSDQGGFGNFIRYDYKDEVKELPCAEANGFPEDHSECLGTFVKHMWLGGSDQFKIGLLKIAIGQMIPGKFLEVFHKQMLEEKKNFFITEEELMSDAWMKKSHP